MRVSSSPFRSIAVAVAVSLVATLAGSPPARATAEIRPDLKPQIERVVPGGAQPVVPYQPDPSAKAVVTTLAAPVWPPAGVSTVDVSPAAGAATAGVRAGSLPVSVRAATSGARTTNADAVPGRVRVELLDRRAATGPIRDGLLLRVARADGVAAAGAVGLSVDYSAFRNAYGGDWANRLRLVRLPECALHGQPGPECQPVSLASANSATAGTVSATVPVAEAASTLLALTAAPSGSTGSFAATTLSAASTWQAGGSSGDFRWSYPMRVPPSTNGPAPTIGLAYASGTVDGRTAASNNQPSWIGEGFDFWPGYVQRRYRPCSEDMGSGANNTVKTGDQCWATDNAFLSLNGSAVELIRDTATGAWRPRSDDGSQITVVKGGGNGDNDGEYWKVVTSDGTQYHFGLNRLPGWVQGGAETNSTLLAPVFGNHAGEPCHQSTFAASWCTQAHTWNLDYVVDVHNNTMSLWYGKETNKYAKNLATTAAVGYDRGGYLVRVDYNTRLTGGVDTVHSGQPPARVLFGTGDRCLSDCGVHDGAHWPDTPWDQECTGTSCSWSTPTFWTTRRLASVTTQVWGGSGYRDVDSWTLRHAFLQPGDTTRPGLWLAGITQAGRVGGAVTLPEVTLTGIAMHNRVDAVDHSPPMNWFRLASIRTEAGGEISVEYSPRDCVANSRVPSAPDANTLRCYPVRWTPDGGTGPVNDYFHKYVVTAVAEVDRTGGAPRKLTRYEYGQLNPSAPLWHYDDDDGIVVNPYKTWGQWRGYERVRTRKGDNGISNLTEARYFRGMHGDRLASGGSRSVSIPDSEGNGIADEESFGGMTRETISYADEAGTIVQSATAYQPWKSAPTASRTTAPAASAHYVDTAVTSKRTLLDGGRGYLRTRTTTMFDAYGMPSQVDNVGDLSTSADDQCVRTTYGRNLSRNLLTPVQRVEALAIPCAATPSTEDDIGSDVRYSFDGLAYGAVPTAGDVTRVEELSRWTPSPVYVTNARTRYDAHGRAVEVWDAEGVSATTAYTPATGGPVTAVVSTNALGHAETTSLEPAWGLTLSTVDANGRRTDQAYDALGRLTSVWLPNRAKGTDSPSLKYSYLVRTDGAVAVTTESLNAVGGYRVSYQLYDSLMRERQTQTPAYGGGRIITEAGYDSVGRVWKTNNQYVADGAAGTTVFTPQGDQVIPSQQVILFDGNGRPRSSVHRSYGTDRWDSTVVYGGDRIDGATRGTGAVSRVENARGEIVKLRQYQVGTTTGVPDETSYRYDRRGNLTQLTDPAGNSWRYEYDLMGRTVKAHDPDNGTTTYTYTATDQVETSTDSRGTKLLFTYDTLGRRTGVYEGSTSGRKRASWTYDTLANGASAKGLVATATRWVDGVAYTDSVGGYNSLYQPTSTSTTIPAPEGALAGTYTTRYTFRADGSPNTTTLPAAGGLPAETVTFGYEDSLGLPMSLSGLTSYVTGVTYTRFSEPAVVTRSIGGKIVQTGHYYNAATRFMERVLAVRETGPATVADVNYTHNAAGNITSIVDRPPGVAADTQCFAYDYLNRMTEAWTPGGGDCTAAPTAASLGGPAPYWQSWTFDKVGNRKTQTKHATATGDQTTTYTYPAAGSAQPHSLRGTSTVDSTGTRTATYGYDSAGNTTSRPGATGAQTLAWDPQGRLASVTEAGQQSTFLYGAEGDRLMRRDARESVLYLGSTEIRLDRGTGGVSARRYYSHITGTIAMRTATALTWLISDDQGTNEIAIDAGTQTVTQRRHTPYGEARGPSASWLDERGFLGGAKDPTGLTHLGMREYDPDTGRFVSVDPIADQGNAQQLNGFAYANNNPVSVSDPSGGEFCVAGNNTFLCKLQCFFGCGGPRDLDEDGVVSAGDMAGSAVAAHCTGIGCGALVEITKGSVDLWADLSPIPINEFMACQQGRLSGCIWTGLSFVSLLDDAHTVTKAITYGTKMSRGAKTLTALKLTLGKLDQALNAVFMLIDLGLASARFVLSKIKEISDAIKAVKTAIGKVKTGTVTKVKRVTAKVKGSGGTKAVSPTTPSSTVGRGPSVGGGTGGGGSGTTGAGPAVAPAKRPGPTVLGHYKNPPGAPGRGYVEMAEAIGARYFSIPSPIWNAMTPDEQWAANERFLERTIKRGDMIILSTPFSYARPGSPFAKELQYLWDHGYRPSPDGRFMMWPGYGFT
ncbi:MAG TPA: RHS repeat-associated core domain-containing protein [Candidatus Limnocylindrales bacterium]